MSNETLRKDAHTLDVFLGKLLRGLIPAETVAAMMADRETVEAVYDHMLDTLNQTQTKIVALKAALDDEWAAPSFTPQAPALRQQLGATKVFLMHLRTEMPKWKRVRSAHRNAANTNGHTGHTGHQREETRP